jgi:YVTN family beta-propeller protein
MWTLAMKRRVSRGQVTRSILGCSRVIQIIRISCRQDGIAIVHLCHPYYNHVEYATPQGGDPRENTNMLVPKLPSLACAVTALVCSSVAGRAAEVKGPLILETTIQLPDVSGCLEHLAVDANGKRLFVAETDSNAVDIIDLSTHQRLRRVTGLSHPRGLGYLPGVDLLVVANGADGTVRFYGGADFSLRGNAIRIPQRAEREARVQYKTGGADSPPGLLH